MPNIHTIDAIDWSLETVQNKKSKLRKSPLLLLIVAALTLSACSTFKGDKSAAPLSNEKNNPVFSEPLDKNDPKFTPSDLATLVFYRPGTASGNDKPLNVYVNGRFLTSLLPGGYVEHSNCAGPMEVAAVFDDARIRHLGKPGHEIAIPIEAGKTYYFEANSSGDESQALLTQVETKTVFLGQYRRQSHVLTRAPNCVASTPVAPVAPVAATLPVAPVAATPLIAAAPLVMPAPETVKAPLESWRAAWEGGNYEAYKSFYAPDFKGTLPSRKAWEQQRKARLNNSAKSIVLENLAIKSTPDSVLTEFKQVYKSKQFDDIGQKRLVWKPVKGELKIVEEGFIGK